MLHFPSLLPFLLLFSSNATANHRPPSLHCSERCGRHPIPYPFYLNSTCGLSSVSAFHLSCNHNSTLSLTTNASTLHVLDFFPSTSTLLVDFSTRSSQSYFHFNDPNVLRKNPHFGVSGRNVLRLYDCEDSSVCEAECEGNVGSGGCCYALSGGNVWKYGDDFSVFLEFGCRGFSSWVVRDSGNDSHQKVIRQGLEIEWAVPRKTSESSSACVEEAIVVNATAVEGGVRCACTGAFTGDGFVNGDGCSKSCGINRNLHYADHECCTSKICQTKATILIGILVAVLSLAAFAMLCAIIRWQFFKSTDEVNWNSKDTYCASNICTSNSTARLFTYRELSKATGGFNDEYDEDDDDDDNNNNSDVDQSILYTGQLEDGILVFIQRFRCDNEEIFAGIPEKLALLSQISHKNLVRIIGWCVDSANTLFLVHQFVQSSGSLQQQVGLNWSTRLSLVVEVANLLVHLQFEISPPFYPHDLKSTDIIIDTEYSAKITASKLLIMSNNSTTTTNIVFDFGHILLEIVVGREYLDRICDDVMKQKLRCGELEDVVDPLLGYTNNLTSKERKQVKRVRDVATQCLLFCEGGVDFCMVDVMRELNFIMKLTESCSSRGPSLEVTFSNSSLLQMISMSPDQSK